MTKLLKTVKRIVFNTIGSDKMKVRFFITSKKKGRLERVWSKYLYGSEGVRNLCKIREEDFR